MSKDSFSLLFIESKQGSEFGTPGLVNLKLILIFFFFRFLIVFIRLKQGYEFRTRGLVNLKLIFQREIFTY